jgi:hypothetical protein
MLHDEGWRRLHRGTSLAQFGVRSGVLRFIGYEKMKGWAFERKWWHVAKPVCVDDGPDRPVCLHALTETDPTKITSSTSLIPHIQLHRGR